MSGAARAFSLFKSHAFCVFVLSLLYINIKEDI
jgi:hypothetical protein